MSGDPVKAIADAVLYEGYMLWPYRRSALKNQQRFSFGGVYPSAFAESWSERSEIATDLLLQFNDLSEPVIEVELRCLHLLDRQPLQRVGEKLEPVDELIVGSERYVAWQEAREQSVRSGPMSLAELLDVRRVPLELAAGQTIEQLDKDSGLCRSWEELSGDLSIQGSLVDDDLLRLSLRLHNDSPWSGNERPGAVARAFLSAHFVAHCVAGRFVSQIDPPTELQAAVASCRHDGLWPVLVGERGQRDTVLASPIILEDYPSVAPESPGDLFDGGEIDALLIHSIRGLTDAEREEMRATDPRTRMILERSMELAPEQMQRLYGAVRETRRVES